jgi:soluble lytic murein transglycosylase-like protein
MRAFNRFFALAAALVLIGVALAAKDYEPQARPVIQSAAQPAASSGQRVATGNLVDVFRAAGAAYGIDWRLLFAQCWAESNFILNARGAAGEKGMAQFMPVTWQRFGRGDPDNPVNAAYAQARYLRYIANYLNTNDLALIVGAYNAGEGSAGAQSRNFGLVQK